MKMAAGMLALCAAASATSWEANTVEGVAHRAETVIANDAFFGAGRHTVLHYIGYGRGANVRAGTFATGACAPKVDLVYALRDHQAIENKTCLKEDGPCGTTGSDNICVPAVHNERKVCIAVEEANGHGYGNQVADEFEWVASTDIPRVGEFQYKSHGTLNYEWFVRAEFTVTDACANTGYGVSMAMIQPISPDQFFCVARTDSHQALDANEEKAEVKYESAVPGNLHQYPFRNVSHDIKYFAEYADLPVNPDAKFIAEDLNVNGPSAGEASTSHYWNLGASPQIDFSCLNVWLTSAGKSEFAECQAVQNNLGANANGDWSFNLLEVSDCGIAPFPESSCCAMRKEECTLPNTAGDSLCWWNEQEEQCYENPKQKIDLRTIGQGEHDNLYSAHSTMVHSFISNEVNGRSSAWITDLDAIARGIDGYNRKRWFFELEMNEKPVGGRCEWSASVSFATHTSGGICEPTTRSRCDLQADACFANDYPVTAWPRFWRHFETANEVVSTNGEDQYKQCNCLKQKEICYRQGGCYSTKKYSMILENCNEVGCGNWCNSAGAAQWSFAALLVAALALML